MEPYEICFTLLDGFVYDKGSKIRVLHRTLVLRKLYKTRLYK